MLQRELDVLAKVIRNFDMPTPQKKALLDDLADAFFREDPLFNHKRFKTIGWPQIGDRE